jgi:hypothetical protein
LVAFGATRTYHRITCAIEDAGFEVRDSLSWLYGTGMPKSMDVAQAIDRQRDDREDILKVTAWIRSVRNAAGVTNQAIDEAFGFNGMSSHWTSVKSQPSIPTLDQVPRLLEVLRVDRKQMPEDVARLLVDLNTRKGQPGEAWQQREVVGHHKGVAGNSKWAATYFGKAAAPAKAITKAASDDAKRWEGWGTTLRPACEPAVLARKPMAGRVVDNLKAHGVGAITRRDGGPLTSWSTKKPPPSSTPRLAVRSLASSTVPRRQPRSANGASPKVPRRLGTYIPRSSRWT